MSIAVGTSWSGDVVLDTVTPDVLGDGQLRDHWS
jgi:hypothetical protein